MAAALTTSEHGGVIRGLVTVAAPNAPLDTAVVRDGVINNLNHLADSAGQVLISFVSPTTAYEMASPAPTSAYQLVTTLPPMAIPVRIRHDGSTYRIIVHAKCSISAAGTASFRFAVRFSGVRGPPPSPSDGHTWVADVSTTSTSGQDLVASPMYASAAAIARIDSSTGLGYLTTEESEDGALNPAATQVLYASFEVWAKSSVSTSLPRVQSINAREWIGGE